MAQKQHKIDSRVKVLIENCIRTNQRSMFVIVGDDADYLVIKLHRILERAAVKASPTVLWCYKKELGFGRHTKKRMKKLIKKREAGALPVTNDDDDFENFLLATRMRKCFYNETQNILGSTYGMCVLQDFEALTPNILARTIETVEGGGMIAILLKTMTSFSQLFTMSMDVHARFRTEAHHDVVPRFNERFLLSLVECQNVLFIDDRWHVLPITSSSLSLTPLPPKNMDDPADPEEVELKQFKETVQDVQPLGALVNLCRTVDQAKAIVKFIESIAEKTLRSTVAMTAARGRGKSATLGLAMAGAIAMGYSNIFVTAPSPENLKAVHEFIFKGFAALHYQEHMDYEIVRSTNPDFRKAVIRVNIFRDHRQTIQYIHPSEHEKLGQAELVCIDEAAAIPLPLVKRLLGPYLVFISSTVHGYEGTGRSLSLKLMRELEKSCMSSNVPASETVDNVKKLVKSNQKILATTLSSSRVVYELTLTNSIRYANGDAVEKWLYDLLCLDVTDLPPLTGGTPDPASCDLYYVNRDTLFSYDHSSETFLKHLVNLYVSSHYKNSPNDLQMLSDAPAHHLFVLIPPCNPKTNQLPQILCVVQVCLEGEISKQTMINSLARGKSASGDLIPWTIAQQFQDHDFGCLSGARVIRIATHPSFQRMGYGRRAMELLQAYYEGKRQSLDENEVPSVSMSTVDKESVPSLKERLQPRTNLSPLLLRLEERPPEHLDYIGVSYGMTYDLLKFWKRFGMAPVYICQRPNDLTGEHTCIMMKTLGESSEKAATDDVWLASYFKDFRRRFVTLLGFEFRSWQSSLALTVLHQTHIKVVPSDVTASELDLFLTPFDLNRLKKYTENLVDYHMIIDMLPTLARLYFLGQLNMTLNESKSAVLLGFGLQYKTVEGIAQELNADIKQILGIFHQLLRQIQTHLSKIQFKAVENEIEPAKEVLMEPVRQTLDDELDEAANEVAASQKQAAAKLFKNVDLSQYKIRGSEDDWRTALNAGTKGIVSLKGSLSEKKRKLINDEETSQKKKNKKKKNHNTSEESTSNGLKKKKFKHSDSDHKKKKKLK